MALFLEQVNNRRQRRHVPNHRHGAVLGVQGQSHLPLLRQLVHGRLLSCSNPRIGDVVLTSLLNHSRIRRIKHQRQLSLVEVLLILNRSSLSHAVCIVEEDTDVAHTTNTGLSTHGRNTSLNTGVAEGTLLSLTRLVVEVHLLVGATGDALTPTAATVLVNQNDTVLSALVDSAGGARSHAGGVQAVLTNTRQVEHEGLLELELNLVLSLLANLLNQRVQVTVLGRTSQVVVPVHTPLDLGVLTGDEGDRLSSREVITQRSTGQVLVIVGPGLVVVVQLGLNRGSEDREELLEAVTALELQTTALVQHPAALPLLLILVTAGVTLTGTSLNVVEPDVLGTGSVRPCLLTGHGAGVAADALIERHHHSNLCHNAH